MRLELFPDDSSHISRNEPWINDLLQRKIGFIFQDKLLRKIGHIEIFKISVFPKVWKATESIELVFTLNDILHNKNNEHRQKKPAFTSLTDDLSSSFTLNSVQSPSHSSEASVERQSDLHISTRQINNSELFLDICKILQFHLCCIRTLIGERNQLLLLGKKVYFRLCFVKNTFLCG